MLLAVCVCVWGVLGGADVLCVAFSEPFVLPARGRKLLETGDIGRYYPLNAEGMVE